MFDAEQARKNSEAKRCEVLGDIMEVLLSEIEEVSKNGLRECVITNISRNTAYEPYIQLFDMIRTQSFTNEWKGIKNRLEILGFEVTVTQTESFIKIVMNW